MQAEASNSWQDKYYAQLDTLDRKQRDWGSLDALLRHTISRLSVAAEGQDPALDGHLKALRGALKNKIDQARLKKITDSISAALRDLEDASADNGRSQVKLLQALLTELEFPPGKRKAQKILAVKLFNANDAAIEGLLAESAGLIQSLISAQQQTTPEPAKPGLFGRLLSSARDNDPAPEVEKQDGKGPGELLIALLDLLSIPTGLEADTAALVARLSQQDDSADWTPLLKDVAALINRVQQNLKEEKREIESFLQQMTGRLKEMDHFLRESNNSLLSAQAAGEALDEDMNEHVSGIAQEVRQATELAALKQAVSVKLDTISGRIEQYRQIERQRNAQSLSELDTMQARMASLEQETVSLKQVIDEKSRQANMDALTEVPNRFAFNNRVEEEIKRHQQSGNNLHIAIWDIDLFKKVNDTYGHTAGDKVLFKIAQTLNKGIREVDFFARFGGEEFVLLMPDMNDADVLDRLNILRSQVEACRFAYHGEALTVTVSCGVSHFSSDDTVDTALERADTALYQAKEQGRNRVCGSSDMN